MAEALTDLDRLRSARLFRQLAGDSPTISQVQLQEFLTGHPNKETLFAPLLSSFADTPELNPDAFLKACFSVYLVDLICETFLTLLFFEIFSTEPCSFSLGFHQSRKRRSSRCRWAAVEPLYREAVRLDIIPTKKARRTPSPSLSNLSLETTQTSTNASPLPTSSMLFGMESCSATSSTRLSRTQFPRASSTRSRTTTSCK